MPESVPVRCPACRRERRYVAPAYPCACGTPVTPALDAGAAPAVVTHRAWSDEWVTLPCPACGRPASWPHPELGCPCGTVLRIPVTGEPGGVEHETAPADPGERGPVRNPGAPPRQATPDPHGRAADPSPHRPAAEPDPRAPAPGPATDPGPGPRTPSPVAQAAGAGVPGPRTPDTAGLPLTDRPIRSARDAVTVVVLYLRRLGHGDVRRADQRPTSGIGLAARGLVVQVDPGRRPASARDVECLWLTAMTESACCLHISLSGHTGEARAAADALGVPLFLLDLAGTVQPVNGPAAALHRRAQGRP